MSNVTYIRWEIRLLHKTGAECYFKMRGESRATKGDKEKKTEYNNVMEKKEEAGGKMVDQF